MKCEACKKRKRKRLLPGAKTTGVCEVCGIWYLRGLTRKGRAVKARSGKLVRFVHYLVDGTQVWKAVRGKEVFNLAGIGAATWGPKRGERGYISMQKGASFHLPFVARA